MNLGGSISPRFQGQLSFSHYTRILIIPIKKPLLRIIFWMETWYGGKMIFLLVPFLITLWLDFQKNTESAKWCLISILDRRSKRRFFMREIQERSLRPNQFFEGHSYFETVKTFFNQKFNLLPITALEYLEYDSLIFVSCYLQENDLTNYLFIISADGNLLLKEKLDEHLKGIGLDTFFVLSGYVFFVKNKVELVCYKIL